MHEEGELVGQNFLREHDLYIDCLKKSYEFTSHSISLNLLNGRDGVETSIAKISG